MLTLPSREDWTPLWWKVTFLASPLNVRTSRPLILCWTLHSVHPWTRVSFFSGSLPGLSTSNTWDVFSYWFILVLYSMERLLSMVCYSSVQCIALIFLEWNRRLLTLFLHHSSILLCEISYITNKQCSVIEMLKRVFLVIFWSLYIKGFITVAWVKYSPTSSIIHCMNMLIMFLIIWGGLWTMWCSW